ncbi:MAG: PhzF family phenazine biosynthesis protein [Desulfovibrionaceae bacterium]|jgi:PhzF family phenazine biosynthesis protein
MELDYYQVDAFSSKVFFGNPAAVCPLSEWLDDGLMQLIAAENNLPETAFFVSSGDRFELRWFTPKTEIDLCGHATLATAHVIFDLMGFHGGCLFFDTKSGELSVEKKNGLLSMDFPSWRPKPIPMAERIVHSLGAKPARLLASRDVLAVFDDPEQVVALEPDMRLLAQCDATCVIATAPGKDYDFISRVFAPAVGIPEDPVTGSAHCTLTPYWAERLGKRELHAFQASERGGELFCKEKGDRVEVAGYAACYMKGTIYL